MGVRLDVSDNGGFPRANSRTSRTATPLSISPGYLYRVEIPVFKSLLGNRTHGLICVMFGEANPG